VLHKEIPFLRIIVPFCAGIVSGLYFSPGPVFIILFAAIIILLFFISLRFNKTLTNPVYGVSITIAFYISGLMLYKYEIESISVLPPGEALYSGYLDDYPEEKENTFKLLLRTDKRISREGQSKVNGTILLYCRKNQVISSMLPGDLLTVRCSPDEITSRGNPYEFDYRFYMETRGIRYYAFTDSSDIIRHSIPETRKLTHRALIIREKIINMFRERGIQGERLALVSAITLGQKNMLDPEQKTWFIKAGVMHIMAVSGLHAVILSLFIFKLLFFMKGRLNILRVIITLILLWSFAFVTGLTPSVLRATLMFSFLQAGNLLKRPANGINSVLASAFVLTLIRPSVIFDAGFLLSYAAVIYIIAFYRDFYLKIRFTRRIADWIWQSAAVTIIAQAGTLPLTLLLFNRFPTWFILSNIVIVPVSSLVIIAGALVPLTYPVYFLSHFIASILDFLTGLTETLTEKAASLPLSTIENIGMTTIECILLTVSIFLFTRFFLTRKSISVIYPLSALLLFLTAGTVRCIATRATNQLIVYNTQGHLTVGVREGIRVSLYSDTCVLGQEVKRHSAVLSLKPDVNVISASPTLIKALNKRILITENVTEKVIAQVRPDIIILSGSHPVVFRNAGRGERISAVIISPEASAGFRIPVKAAVADADTVHYVRKDGAFYIRL
jgi:competence protein ComEC